MGLIAKDGGGGDFEPLAPGTYVARCVRVLDFGIQDTKFGGKEKVYLGFEIPSERVTWTDGDGNEKNGPAFIGDRYTMSISDKSILGQHLTSWRGKPFTDEERQGFDLFVLLGIPCMITVVHNQSSGKTYANIQGIFRLPKGTECPPVESELIGYTPMDEQYAGNFDKLTEWQQRIVRDGYKMADDSTVVGSRAASMGNVSGQNVNPPAAPVAPPAPSAPTVYPTGQPAYPTDGDFDDDIPF